MSISIREYKASNKVLLTADMLRDATGANQFYTLLAALIKTAGGVELSMIGSVFPEEVQGMIERIHSQGGLLPGEEFTEDGYHCWRTAEGKVLWETEDEYKAKKAQL